jgi:putative radical SAM enzyme (TIGR03279 family)
LTRGSYEAAVGHAAPAGGAERGETPLALVRDVAPASPAERAGVRAGDRVVAVDGESVRDVIDWRWLTAEPSFVITLEGDGPGAARDVRVEREWDEPVGVEFDGVVFDGIRTCENACAFCFVAQLPSGLRPSLYVRDDDYRLSFLAGTFITLTNLTDDDVDRIAEQALSPLYVSLHAVDDEVRRRLLCPTVADGAVKRLEELLSEGIELHVQIVLVPGVNDGHVLQETLRWLSARTGVESVGVVPLGYTSHQSRFSGSFGRPEAAAAVLDALEPWREAMVADRGVRWVHAADELYLAAGREVPAAAAYDSFPQYENGIGLVRVFLDGWEDVVHSTPVRSGDAQVCATLLTGELFAPTLRRAVPLAARHGVACSVLPVRNRFLGGNVSVAGLLSGADIAEAIRADGARRANDDRGAHDTRVPSAEAGAPPADHRAGQGAATTYLVPDVVLNEDGLTLDGMTEDDIAARSCACVRVVSCDAAGLLEALLLLPEAPPHLRSKDSDRT